jgi:UDP-N-acetylmuramoyl-L-alanine---L-glutamate ligase
MAPSRIGIWGYGEEGRACLAWLRTQYPAAAFTILNEMPLAAAPAGCAVLTGDAALEAIASSQFTLIAKSPGVSLYQPEIKAAKAAGTVFTSATNLWFAAHPQAKNVVAVSGTKGKSTSVSLLHFLLTQAGRDAPLYGNVGTAMLGKPSGVDATVLELSSYQIADMTGAPGYALLTSLYPEHGPWHQGHENYFRDKLGLADLADTTFANGADTLLRQHLNRHPKVQWYNTPAGFAASIIGLTYKGHPVPITNNPLRGLHNLHNLAGVCTVLQALGLDVTAGIDLTSFTPLPHRLQEVGLPNGVLCVNDSISTVPQATLAALQAYATSCPGRPITLIAGGTDRGQDFTELAAQLAGLGVVRLITLPPVGVKLAQAVAAAAPGIEQHAAATLAVAVQYAMQHTANTGIILLSPAAPSFSEFTNFMARGEAFLGLCKTVDFSF